MTARLIVSTPETKERIRVRHARGELARARRGYYAERGTDGMIPAAVARLSAVASHTTAAALWEMPFLRRPETSVHLSRVRRKQGTLRGYPGVVLHHAALPPEHIALHSGVPVTTPARTVVDLARAQPFRAAVVVADAALRLRRCTKEELVAVLAQCRGWPGTRQAHRVVAFADPRAESPLESISRVTFHEYDLPMPTLQAEIDGYDRADFLWPSYRVIGEADGMSKYTEPDVLRREKIREENFVQMGFTVFRWTWRDAYRRPDALAHRGLEVLTRCGYRPERASR